MTRERQTGEAGRVARRRGWAIAFSLAAHAAALTVLTWTTPALRIPLAEWRPDVTVQLERPRPASPRAQAAAPPSPRAAAAPAPAAPPVPTRRAPFTPPSPIPPATRPVRPSPSPAPLALPPIPTPGPAARPGPPGPPAPQPGAGQSGGDVRGAVRAAIGCDHEDFLKLTPAERAACQRKMAEAPPHTGAYVDPIPPLKRGAYDRQAASDARRRDHEGPMGNPIVRCDGIGSNFGTGCLPPEAMHSLRFGSTPRPPAPDPPEP